MYELRTWWQMNNVIKQDWKRCFHSYAADPAHKIQLLKNAQMFELKKAQFLKMGKSLYNNYKVVTLIQLLSNAE